MLAYLCCTSFSPPSAKFPCSKSHLGLDFLFAGFQEKPKYGFSTAIGLSKSVINFAFLLLANKLAKALGEGGIM